MKYSLIFWISCMAFMTHSVAAQDTVTVFRDVDGNRVPFDRAFYFEYKAKDSAKNLTQTRICSFFCYDEVYKLRSPKPDLSVKNGHFVFIDEKGIVRMDAFFFNDDIHGMQTLYYPDGKTKDVEFYQNGIRYGECTYYHPNGIKSSVEHYQADSLLSFELYNPDGTPNTTLQTPSSNAEFPGGIQTLQWFLVQNIIYPQDALEHGIFGRCYVAFDIDTSGKISNVEIKRGVPDCFECDREAVRVVKAMPNWTPAIDHNRIVATRYLLPITFAISTK